jgi:hypothetical protein
MREPKTKGVTIFFFNIFSYFSHYHQISLKLMKFSYRTNQMEGKFHEIRNKVAFKGSLQLITRMIYVMYS